MTKPKKRRSSVNLLRFVLLLTILSSVLNLILIVVLPDGQRTLPEAASLTRRVYDVVSNILIIIFLVGAMRWKKWGCFGYIALVLISAVVVVLFFPATASESSLSSPLTVTFLSLGHAAIAYGVYREYREKFE